MANAGQDREDLVGSQRENQFVNLERKRDRQHTPSVMVEYNHTKRTKRSHTKSRSHVSHDQETLKLQREVDHLGRKLRCRRHDKRSPSSPSSKGSGGSRDRSYRCRSKTPPNESYSSSSQQDKLEKGHNKRRKRPFHHTMRNNAMSKALRQISKSLFIRRINKAKLLHRFSQPTFTIHNGRIDPVEHVSHFNQKIVVHTSNKALMCKVFPSNLRLVVMCWFDALEKASIRSFEELTRAFGARFITCSKVPRPVDSLLSMAMRKGEYLKTYSNWYWEMYNEIDGYFKDVAMRTFKVGLPIEHDLGKSLTMKFALNMRQLMDRINKYKRLEEDQM